MPWAPRRGSADAQEHGGDSADSMKAAQRLADPPAVHPRRFPPMTQPSVATSVGQLLELLAGVASLDGDQLRIDDEAAFRDRGIRDVVWSATFSEDADTVEAARWIVWEASQLLDGRSGSIH